MRFRARGSFAIVLAAAVTACGGGAGSASITVAGADGGLAGADVVFHDPDGVPLAHETTDADGRASAPVDEGGMITVLIDPDGARVRATVVGVAPGDELRLDVPDRAVPEVGTAHVTVAPYPGGGLYLVQTACALVYTGDVSAPIAVDVTTRCLSPDGTFPVLTTVLDADGDPIAYAALRDLPWAELMELAMPAWRPTAALAVDATGAPYGALGVSLSVSYDVNDLFLDGPRSDAVLAPGQSASLAVPFAPDFPDRVGTQVEVAFGDSTAEVDGLSWVTSWRAVPPAWREVDLAAELLPRIAVLGPDTSDPSRPTLSWMGGGDRAAIDGGLVRFRWDEAERPYQRWTLLIPPETGSPVRVPALPDALAAWSPSAATEHHEGRIELVDLDTVGSYEELRSGVGLGWVLGDADALYRGGDVSVRITRSGDL